MRARVLPRYIQCRGWPTSPGVHRGSGRVVSCWGSHCRHECCGPLRYPIQGRCRRRAGGFRGWPPQVRPPQWCRGPRESSKNTKDLSVLGVTSLRVSARQIRRACFRETGTARPLVGRHRGRDGIGQARPVVIRQNGKHTIGGEAVLFPECSESRGLDLHDARALRSGHNPLDFSRNRHSTRLFGNPSFFVICWTKPVVIDVLDDVDSL